MKAAYRTLEVERGAKFDWQFTIKVGDPLAPIDLSGATASFVVTDSANMTGDTVLALTETSGITLGGTAGTVRVEIAPSDTLLFPMRVGSYKFDINGERWLKGDLRVND